MLKQVIAIRKDLDWGKGKLVAHAVHAALGSARLVDEKILQEWESSGAKKIVVKVSSEKELKEVEKKAKKAKLPCFLVRDAGLTQLKKGTLTALAIGPVEGEKIDKITGKLKLF